MRRSLVDTGSLVALLNRRDRFHCLVRGVLNLVEPPILTCEAVVSEARFHTRAARAGYRERSRLGFRSFSV
jgi:predicted nucleic acid-binding protein